MPCVIAGPMGAELFFSFMRHHDGERERERVWVGEGNEKCCSCKNKLNGIYVYRHKHDYILCSMFTITKVQLHVSVINVGLIRLYVRNLSISYTNVCGEFTVCGVGWVRDLVLEKRVWTGAVYSL